MAKPRKWTRELINIKLAAEGRGVTCIEYGGKTAARSYWVCDEGHKWWGVANNVINGVGVGCRECAANSARKWCLQSVNDALHKKCRSIVCLGYAGGVLGRSHWRCGAGHEWRSTLNSVVNQGTGCPTCGGRPRVDADEARRRLDADRRGILLVAYGGNSAASSSFKCVCGHEFVATLNSVRSRTGKGCPVCDAGTNDRKEETTEVRARRRLHEDGRGITLIEYGGKVHKSRFVCLEGHEWAAELNAVCGVHKTGCPVCASYGFNPSQLAHLYYFRLLSPGFTLYKVGVTNNHPLDRAKTLGASCSYELLDSCCVPEGSFVLPVEQHILRLHAQHSAEAEARSILRNGYTECFTHDVLNIERGERLHNYVREYWRLQNILS